jgi:DNA-directed RNA polymerase specialized sigma24 family protein
MSAIDGGPSIEGWEESRLLRAWRQGDVKAGRELFARHYDTIYRFFDSKIKRDILELVEGTFLDCSRGADAHVQPDARAELLTIATSRLYDYFRNEHVLENAVSTERAFDPAKHSLQALGGYPSTMIGTEPELRLLREAVPRIPLGEQILLELCFEEEPLTGSALARVLGGDARTLPSRLESAWRHLEQELSRIEDDEAAVVATREAMRGRLDEARRRCAETLASQ